MSEFILQNMLVCYFLISYHNRSGLCGVKSGACQSVWIAEIWAWQTVSFIAYVVLFLALIQTSTRYHAPGVKTTLVAAGHTITPLFSKASLPSSWLHKFCTPSLPPHTIAKAVITAIDEQESKMIFLPFYTHFVRWIVILPSYLRDFFQWVRWSFRM